MKTASRATNKSLSNHIWLIGDDVDIRQKAEQPKEEFEIEMTEKQKREEKKLIDSILEKQKSQE